MSDPPVTHNELALAMEQVRRHAAALSAMVMSVDKPDFQEIFKEFQARDAEYVAFIEALRGGGDGRG